MPEPEPNPTPDPEARQAAVDAADRRAETRELEFYAAAERALAARRSVRRVFGDQLGLDGRPIGPRVAHAPALLRRLGATLTEALEAKRRWELAGLETGARRRALSEATGTPDD